MEENKKTELNEMEQTTAEVKEEDTENSETVESPTPTTPPNVVKLKQRRWLPYVITTAVLAVFTVLIGWASGGFTATSTEDLMRSWSNGFSVSGVLGVGFGLLVFASNGGVFDMLTYAARSVFRLFKKDPIDRKYGGFYEYQQARRQKKRSFWYMVIVGGVYLAVGIALLIVHIEKR